MAEDDRKFGLKPGDFILDIDLCDEDEPYDSSDGNSQGDLFYTEGELEQLGGGDPMKGLVRILESMDTEPESIDSVMNPRRPFQDELDLLMPPQDPQKPN